MRQHNIGVMIYFGKPFYTLAQRLFGRRWLIIHKDFNTYKNIFSTHFTGQTRDGQVFVWCPISQIASWSKGDVDHKWCHACQLFFSQHVEQLLDPHEKHKAAA